MAFGMKWVRLSVGGDVVHEIRDSYRRLANELITQLKLVDAFDSEASQKTAGPEEFPRFLWSAQQKAS
jgi:hypothetical protein